MYSTPLFYDVHTRSAGAAAASAVLWSFSSDTVFQFLKLNARPSVHTSKHLSLSTAAKGA